MTKRQLSEQQKRRIKRQQSVLWRQLDDQTLQQLLSQSSATGGQLGLLVACFGPTVEIEDEHGQRFHCALRQHLGGLVPGDRVIWQPSGPKQGVIVTKCPRQTTLGRPDAQGVLKALAANVDQMIIVMAPEPEPVPSLLDSYLVMAETLELHPLIVLNKIDLLSAQQKLDLQDFLQRYQQLSYTLCYTSTTQKQELASLKPHLHHKTSVFVGQSGVGKSAIIATLLPDEKISVGELVTRHKQGAHTTTTARLYHLPNQSGDVIDSPGIRELGLWHMSTAEIARGFKEFREFIPQCKYRNCSHQHEPACAVIQAVKSGHISRQRLDNYYLFLEKQHH